MQAHSSRKKPTNLSLDQDLLHEAKAYGINLSRASETGIRQAVARAMSESWKQENAAALTSSSQWVEAHGLPLDKYRQF